MSRSRFLTQKKFKILITGKYITAIIALIFILVSGISCKKDDVRATFEMRYTLEFNIPAGLNTFTFHQFVVQNQATGIDFFLDQNGLKKEDIATINTSFAEVTTFLGDEDLSMLDEVVIDVFKPQQREINFEAAHTIQIPFRKTSRIQLLPSITNLKEVLTGREFDLVMHMRFRSLPPRNFTAILEIEFEAFRE